MPLWVLQVRCFLRSLEDPQSVAFWTNLDFSHYYITAERVISGISNVYCVPFTPEETALRGIETGDILAPTNPPLLTLALSPLAYLPIHQAWLIYTGIGLTLLVMALWITMRRCEGFSTAAAKSGLLLLVTASAPMLLVLQFSQVQGWMLALIICAWSLMPKHPIPAGIILGITVPLKVYSAPLLAFIFATRNYRMLFAALCAAIIGILLPQFIDPRLNIFQFLNCGAAHVSTWALDSSTNQSVSGLLRSIAYLTLIPLGVADLQQIKLVTHYGGIVLWMASGFLVGVVFRNRREPNQGFLASLALSTIFAPLAWPHYFLMTWPYLIQQWSRLALGARLILWFSFPLYPCYIVGGKNPDWVDIITNLEGSLLVWFPGTIFTIQLCAILYKDITRRNH